MGRTKVIKNNNKIENLKLNGNRACPERENAVYYNKEYKNIEKQ